MAQVSDLARYILSLEHQDNEVHLTLCNYIVHRSQPDQRLDIDFMTRFFSTCLTFPHWQSRKDILVGETIQALRDLSNDAGSNINLAFDVHELSGWKHVQVIGIESDQNLFEIVSQYEQKNLEKEASLRVLVDEDRKGIASIVLKKNGHLYFKYYGRFALMLKGVLTPAEPLQSLEYDGRLELALDSPQIVEISPYNYGKFSRSNGGIKGCLTKGYSFHKTEVVDVVGLAQVPGIFFSIKKSERFFINRASDPTYSEVVKALENAIALMQSPTPENVRAAQTAYHRAQPIYQHIFSDDKMLFLLLRDLHRTLNSGKDVNPDGASGAKEDICNDLIPIL